MRSSLALLLVVVVTACGDNRAQHAAADAHTSTPHDSTIAVDPDAKEFLDAAPLVGIAAVRAAADGTTSIAVANVTVTYVKPQLGDTTNDPAGFTVQTAQAGPAVFVSVDPATLTPVPVAGDVVSFTVTSKTTVHMQPRVTTLSGFARSATGTTITALAQNISTATDLVTAADNYDSELVTVSGTLVGTVASSGAGFQRAELDTAGITATTALQFRAPATLMSGYDLVAGCTITATNIAFSRFDGNSELVAFNPSELAITTCPAPAVTTAAATATTTVKVTFSRNVDPASIHASGDQFAIAGLTVASDPVVSGRTVTLTTTAQTAAAAYTVVVASTVTDIEGTALAVTLSASFVGFQVPAQVVINELNGLLAGGCDLIELRVTAAGSMGNFKLTERAGSASSNELSLTFPAGFTVAKNDYIVVHFSGGVAACNPGTAVNETATKTDQPTVTYAANFDTAFDFYVTDTSLTATDNVLTLFDSAGIIVDAVFLDDTTASEAAGTTTAASAAGAAAAWAPAQATYTVAEFSAAAVKNLGGTGTTIAGTSIQRVTNTDTNAAADWTTGAGVTSTWGANNAGQADF
ncbi:hypothetical protein BH11MYX1_BH11MYX1_00030 [soil metagenome]